MKDVIDIDGRHGTIRHLSPDEPAEGLCWSAQVAYRKDRIILTCAEHPLPFPGSYDAARLGCKCPITINGAGRAEGAESAVGIRDTTADNSDVIHYRHPKPEVPWVNPNCLLHGYDNTISPKPKRWYQFWRRS